MSIKSKREILFKPTKRQKEFLPAIKWLLSDEMEDRQSGRTTLMAYVFILKAIKNPGKRIYLFDHFGGSLATKRVLMTNIEMILGESLLTHFEVFYPVFSIRFNK